jgi:glycosyltransferase involved in cell wall biosynthesis
MKALMANKFYYGKAGAEKSFLSVKRLFEEKGYEVSVFSMEHPSNMESPYAKYFVSYVDLNNPGGVIASLRAAARILYSFEAKRKIKKLIDDTQPDIAHLSNIYHQLSPSIIDALKDAGVPIVMVLHDYKLTCPAYTHLSPKGICEECKGGRYYNAVVNRCIKGSRLKSAVNMMEMYLHHSILRIYDKVDVFIAPSRFLLEKTKELGVKGEIVLLPNCVHLDGYEPAYGSRERSITYFGRLSHEKGIDTLIDAVKGLNLRLKILGDGPYESKLKKKVLAEGVDNVSFYGYMSGSELNEEIKKSLFTVVPSEWYENNPRSIIESFALGKPVIGANVGGIAELVKDAETGYTFEMGNVEDLREKIKSLVDDESKIVEMGQKARVYVEREHNPERYYKVLMGVYEKLVAKR